MKYVLSAIFAICFFVCHAFDIKVVHDNKPVAGAKVTGYSEAMDSIESAISNQDGIATILSEKTKIIEISHPDFSSCFRRISEIQDGTVSLSPPINLEGIEVVADNKKEFLTHDSFTLSAAQMKQYTNVYNALNEIPNLNVLPTGALYYEGNLNVVLLLNGVRTTREELSTISKDDISKVNVYNTPPARFASQNVSAVIDVITKSDLTGGNIGVAIEQAAVPLWGDNSAAIYYNYARSRFALRINNENQHFSKISENASLKYTFDGTEYEKIKDGRDSKDYKDENSIIASYQNGLQGSYLYNLEIGGKFYRHDRNYAQDVTTDNSRFSADNILKTSYNNFWITNYFEKDLGSAGDRGTVIGNVNYRHFNNRFHSSYSEFEPSTPESPFEEHANDYKTRYDAVFSEFQYSMPEKDWGMLQASLYGNYKYSRYVNSQSPFFQKNSRVGAAAFYFGRIKRLTLIGFLGMNYMYSNTTNFNRPYSKFFPSAIARATFRINNMLRSTLSYSYDSEMPAIAQLSETNQWLDNHLIYHGNASLKPSHIHDLYLSFALSQKYVDATLRLEYQNTPDMICSQYIMKPDYILETIMNLKKYRTYLSQLSLTLKPLGTNKLIISSRIIWAKIEGSGEEYAWTGHRFQWNTSATLRIRRVDLSMYYQYPGQIADGQLIRPRMEAWNLYVSWRCKDNLALGAMIKNPFAKYAKESERSVGSALVQTVSELIVKDWANCVSLTLSWNLSFGKNRNNRNPRYASGDDDTGLLEK